MGPTDEEVLDWFKPKPVSPEKQPERDALRTSFELLAAVILETVPPSADRTTALRSLHRASQDAVFAFTHNQPTPP